MFVLSYIGLADAVCQVIEIPIIVRSLADSLGHLGEDELPVPFHPDLLATLDVGTDGANYDRLVDEYAFPWWMGSVPPAPHEILGSGTIIRCLTMHRNLLPTEAQNPPPPVQTPAVKHGAGDDDCGRCRANDIAVYELKKELREILQFVDGMEFSSFAQLDASRRRAAGLFLLHERVILKESDPATCVLPSNAVAGLCPAPPPTPAPTGRRRQPKRRINAKSRLVSDQAKAALEVLTRIPAPSAKWTWGAELTTAEVLKIGARDTSDDHSGYNMSMPSGSTTGIVSFMPSLPTSSGIFSVVSTSAAHDATLHSTSAGRSGTDPSAGCTPSTLHGAGRTSAAYRRSNAASDDEADADEESNDDATADERMAGEQSSHFQSAGDIDVPVHETARRFRRMNVAVNSYSINPIRAEINAQEAADVWDSSGESAHSASPHSAIDANAHDAADAWTSSDDDTTPSVIHASAHDAADAWSSSDDASTPSVHTLNVTTPTLITYLTHWVATCGVTAESLDLITSHEAEAAWSSSSDSDESSDDNVGVIRADTEDITLPRTYGESDFAYVETHWLDGDVDGMQID
jgi:hypothetical protein